MKNHVLAFVEENLADENNPLPRWVRFACAEIFECANCGYSYEGVAQALVLWAQEELEMGDSVEIFSQQLKKAINQGRKDAIDAGKA